MTQTKIELVKLSSKYRTQTYKSRQLLEDNNSDYESDDDLYCPTQDLGRGAFAEARLFTGENSKKTKVVLKPNTNNNNTPDYKEAENKLRFFNTIYPGEKAKLIPVYSSSNDYRLILPHIPGKNLYRAMAQNKDNLEGLLMLLEGVIAALEDAHYKGIVITDLKADAFLYDEESQKCRLIDGGNSSKIGEKVSEHCIESVRNDMQFHIAPECWYSGTPPRAATSMDVYSLGILMQKMFYRFQRKEIQDLIEKCTKLQPYERMTLSELKKQLFLLKINFDKELENLMDFIQSTPDKQDIYAVATLILYLKLTNARQQYLLSKQPEEESCKAFISSCSSARNGFYNNLCSSDNAVTNTPRCG